MSKHSPSTFSHRVLAWFDQHGRKHLPWQQHRNAYRVWVSEIMLQQTQVTTVIPYYQRFMTQFPDVVALAEAKLDEVLTHWAGLGYYARARNLHHCAQRVVNEYDGTFPHTVDTLITLPGIGRSTAGAIISLAFGRRATILDGNVKRVLARYHGVAGWPGHQAISKTLWTHAETHTPEQRCDDFNQAMMDLGATLCARSKPTCQQCPLARDCVALATSKQPDFPGKKPKKVLPVNSTQWLVMRNRQQDIYLEQRPAQGIWGGLWSFPETDALSDAKRHCEAHYGKVATCTTATPFRHTFSHYHLDIQPILIELTPEQAPIHTNKRKRWFTAAELPTIGMAAPVKKFLNTLWL